MRDNRWEVDQSSAQWSAWSRRGWGPCVLSIREPGAEAEPAGNRALEGAALGEHEEPQRGQTRSGPRRFGDRTTQCAKHEWAVFTEQLGGLVT